MADLSVRATAPIAPHAPSRKSAGAAKDAVNVKSGINVKKNESRLAESREKANAIWISLTSWMLPGYTAKDVRMTPGLHAESIVLTIH